MNENNEDSRNEPSSEHRTSPPAGDGDKEQRPSGAHDPVEEYPFSRNQWENLSSDPDPRTDLGYTGSNWETIETLDNSNQIIFMPEDEELLKDDAFIVADEDVPCDLGEFY